MARGFAAWVGLCALSGCALFNEEQAISRAANKNMLPALSAPADAVDIEVLFVERPINDPLLGRGLWNEMDQLAGIAAERRISILENGFRVALAGTEAPPTLAALLDAGRIEDYDEVSGFWTNRRISLRRSARTEVLCSHEPRTWNVKVSSDGTQTDSEFEKARGFLRVNLEDIRDGWVKLHIQPEIHFGEEVVRREPTDTSWNLSAGQKIEPLGSCGFTVHLSLNEMLVMSADHTAGGKVGNNFFRREEDGRLMQRVVIFRVADLKRFELASR